MPEPSPYATAPPLRRREQPEPRPIPRATILPDSKWHPSLKGLAADSEFLLLAGALLALSGWFFLESGRVRPQNRDVPSMAARASEDVSGTRLAFTFLAESGRDLLLPALQDKPVDAPPPAPALHAAASVEQHALLAEPRFDPLGSLVISGLPAETRLSAGTLLPIGEGAGRAWAVAIGDLENLVIELPLQRMAPLRPTLDLRSRAGLKISSLTLEIRGLSEGAEEEQSVAEPPSAKSKVRPTKAVRPGSKSMRKTVRSPATAATTVPVFPGDPPAQGVKAQKPSFPAPAASTLSGPGLFKPDPKDSASSGLSPALREDPRFMTLRGLGMPPAEGPP